MPVRFDTVPFTTLTSDVEKPVTGSLKVIDTSKAPRTVAPADEATLAVGLPTEAVLRSGMAAVLGRLALSWIAPAPTVTVTAPLSSAMIVAS